MSPPTEPPVFCVDARKFGKEPQSCKARVWIVVVQRRFTCESIVSTVHTIVCRPMILTGKLKSQISCAGMLKLLHSLPPRIAPVAHEVVVTDRRRNELVVYGQGDFHKLREPGLPGDSSFRIIVSASCTGERPLEVHDGLLEELTNNLESKRWRIWSGICGCECLAKSLSDTLVGSVVNVESLISVDNQAATPLVHLQVGVEEFVLVVWSVM